MNNEIMTLIEELADNHSLPEEGYRQLLTGRTPEIDAHLAHRAAAVRKSIYGNAVYTRGLIEISNICKNDCYYCGIRRSNHHCNRYRLTPDQILSCAEEGYALGFRTFVMQGGEDPYFTDEILTDIIRRIKQSYPDCAVTISMGERGYESFRKLREAGADRYLLRHETADRAHYRKLHPPEMSFDHRMQCLQDLRDLGYQVGAGFMVGSPYQTVAELAKDLKFIETFRPEMCGIGPFIPHHDTPFAGYAPGTLELTCALLSIIRLIWPPVLLPATTALGTIHPMGREKGIEAGANVVMPNLSPSGVRKQYELYDGKICTGDESAQNYRHLAERMQLIHYELVTEKGDFKHVTL